MKAKFIIAVMLLIACTSMAQGRFDLSAWVGINMSQVDGDNAGHYQHLGFHGAINTSFSLTPKIDNPWKMVIELGYTQKGSHVDASNMNIDLKYIEIPVMMTYSFWGFRLGAGFAPAILLSSKVDVGGAPDIASSNNYKKFDPLPVTAELRWCGGHFMILARFQTSMLPISKEGGTAYRIFRSNHGQFSRLVSLGVGYKF